MASGEWRPGVLLNKLQCVRPAPPAHKEHPAQSVRVPKLRSPVVKINFCYKLITALDKAGSLQKVTFREKVM